MIRWTAPRAHVLILVCLAATAALAETRNAYFGDLHIHTRYSYDSFFFGTVASPDDAYEFAKGKPMVTPAGATIQLHARRSTSTRSPTTTSSSGSGGRRNTTRTTRTGTIRSCRTSSRATTSATRSASRTTASSRRTSRRRGRTSRRPRSGTTIQGAFTTFIGFEFTPEKDMDGQHRVVDLPGHPRAATPDRPYRDAEPGRPVGLDGPPPGRRHRGAGDPAQHEPLWRTDVRGYVLRRLLRWTSLTRNGACATSRSSRSPR